MARERSPNYPAYGLPAAIQFAKMVWNREKRTAVEMYVIARALGSEGISGPVRSKVAAMRQYGLLEPAGGKLKVSDAAITLILQGPGQREYDETVEKVALAPPLFAEIRKDRPEASDEALNFYLVRDRRFSTDGAKRVIRSYRETLAFAKLDDLSYTPETEETPEEEPDQSQAGGSGGSAQRRPLFRRESLSFNFALPRGVQAQVTFEGERPTKRAVAKLRQYLQLFEDDLPDDQVSGLAPVEETPGAQDEPSL